jgi:purine-binding chemotaxis protein CheW
VTFDLMGEEYALQIQNVREIIEFEPVTTVPSMPPVVRGVMNLRGSVVPVIDLPVKFGLPPTQLGAGAYIVVVDLSWSNEAVRLGLVTRELGRVIDVTDDQIKPVPDFGTRIQSEYLRGVGQIDSRIILFLNIDRLLSPAELLRITAANSLPAAPAPHPEGRRDGAGEA